MRLEKIKLSGFKSFAQATTVAVSSNLMAIVGPNGCGKSNIIDAVRWVIGESSAKHLRGGHMTDVIFNGSGNRQAVAIASVELIFDNSEGKLGGEYAQYSSISIKRQINRDGVAIYLLNNARCLKRDVTNLFLGTGLGTRSYAIIEQGTISRLIEAKPSAMREYIEEAAGISRYKERRHETEIRIRHARENLDRLNDIRGEAEKQFKHLNAQAKKAEKYTLLKQRQRQYKQELLAMSWRRYEQLFSAQEQQLQELSKSHNLASVRQVELRIVQTTKVKQQKEQQQQQQQLQENTYKDTATINHLEQIIAHTKQSHKQLQLELQSLQEQEKNYIANIAQDKQQLKELELQLVTNNNSLAGTQKEEYTNLICQQQALEQQQKWQEKWQKFSNSYATVSGQVGVAQIQIMQLETQLEQLQVRLKILQDERIELSDSQIEIEITTLEQNIGLIKTKHIQLHQRLEELQDSINSSRNQAKKNQDKLHLERSILHDINGKITSLELLQQHAMGKNNQALNSWLKTTNLHNRQRLAESITVDSGWELAVETALKAHLNAICIDNFEQLLEQLHNLKEGSLTLFNTYDTNTPTEQSSLPALLDKIQTPFNLSALLAGVFCADTLESAYQHSLNLPKHQSIITKQGVWLSSGWLKISYTQESHGGVLQREQILRQLKQNQQECQRQLSILEKQLFSVEATLKETENKREALHQQDKLMANDLTTKRIELSTHVARLEQQKQRLQQIFIEIDEINISLSIINKKTTKTQILKKTATQSMETLNNERSKVEQLKLTAQTQHKQATDKVNNVQQQLIRLQAQVGSLQSNQAMTHKQIQRTQSLQQHAGTRIAELKQQYQQSLTPLTDNKTELNNAKQSHTHHTQKLKTVCMQLEQTEQEIKQHNSDITSLQNTIDDDKDMLNNIRLKQQESKVRQKTIAEQLADLAVMAEKILLNMPAQAEENNWKHRLEELSAQIEQLGAINLSAIKEQQTQSTRIDFLNEQQDDLNEALQKLELAINKIDHETRQRFTTTFNKINAGLQSKFLKLFGGGNAYLSLTDADLLESGVTIVTRLPGKKIRSIHMLSGGEKALTAMALVFTIFELNPAPFCLLDEVDAPLDDANVRRFSRLIAEMSKTVQFIFISHNKVTMEIASHLAGVTMQEPGVSRMVTVDIDQAISMAKK